MYVLKFYSGSGKIESEEIDEYKLRRTCKHIPLTNAWVLNENPAIFFIIFPRIKKKEDIDGKRVDAEVVIYSDKTKLKKLQKGDEAYKWKEKTK